MDIKPEDHGKMDWDGCVKKIIAKSVKKDENLIISARKIASLKVESAEVLPETHFIGKISLLYDALREYLECIALENGYKIYNHECYSAFLKEILNLSREAGMFDNLRKIRNGINYYGKEVSKEEAEYIIKELKTLIDKFRK